MKTTTSLRWVVFRSVWLDGLKHNVYKQVVVEKKKRRPQVCVRPACVGACRAFFSILFRWAIGQEKEGQRNVSLALAPDGC